MTAKSIRNASGIFVAVILSIHTAHSEGRTLAVAAEQVAAQLTQGQIVTAETSASSPAQYHAAGHIELAGISPERRIFEIGSITKVFTGLLLAQAVVERRVTLDSTLAEVFGPSQTFADTKVAAITLRQLATHTSGLPRMPATEKADTFAHFGTAELSAYLASAKLEASPPFDYAYSNLGFGILGEALARVYGRPWEQLIAEKITRPLGLSDTVVTLDAEQRARLVPAYDGKETSPHLEFQALAGAGALHSTAADLVLFGEAFIAPEKTPLRGALALLTTPQMRGRPTGLGVGIFEIDGATTYEHAGATYGYRSFWSVAPKTAAIRIVLTNNAALDPEAVCIAARNEKPRQNESSRVVTAEQLEAYVGVYASAAGHFTIARKGTQLMVQITGQLFLPVFPHEISDRFFYKAVPAEIQFQRENGAVTGLALFQNGAQTPARRTKEIAPPILFPSAEALAEFAGTYDFKEGSTLTLAVESDTLFAQISGQAATPVFERRRDWFEFGVAPAALEFERDKTGKISAATIHQNGLKERAAKRLP